PFHARRGLSSDGSLSRPMGRPAITRGGRSGRRHVRTTSIIARTHKAFPAGTRGWDLTVQPSARVWFAGECSGATVSGDRVGHGITHGFEMRAHAQGRLLRVTLLDRFHDRTVVLSIEVLLIRGERSALQPIPFIVRP